MVLVVFFVAVAGRHDVTVVCCYCYLVVVEYESTVRAVGGWSKIF